MSEFRFQLGVKVRDRVSGLEGIIVGRTEWLYGCRRYSVQPEGSKEGKPYEASGFDEDALTLLAETHPAKVGDTGGPQREPESRRDPSR